MKDDKPLLLFIYPLLIVVIFVLPFFSFEGYDILKHTTSQLGAQLTPNAWVMNTVFMLLGGAVIIDSLKSLKGFYVQQVVLIIFASTLILTAIFRHEHITSLFTHNIEAELHSLFATIVGFSFVVFAMSMYFIEEEVKRKQISILMVFITTLLSILIFSMEPLRGLFQRLMFIISFLYLIDIFIHFKNGLNIKEKIND
ncbi:MAG: DUF998 domain-containing protein [Tenericutes bacterium]|nr:DUF998 domain-containing protein [Mycoplasmatota bacterium]